jgi:hypothetical protein
MKLIPQTLQLWQSDNSKDVSFILPAAIRFLRLSHHALEIAHLDSSNTPRVARVAGIGLSRIWPDVVYNRRHEFKTGRINDHVAVTAITPKERSLALLHDAFPPDMDKCRPDCFSIEIGTALDLWSSDSVVAFAVHRQRPEFLLQFPSMAYIATPVQRDYQPLLQRILKDNLVTRQCPLWTVWGGQWRAPVFADPFYFFERIRVVERDLAATGDWNVRIKGPGGPGGPLAGISRPTGPGIDI